MGNQTPFQALSSSSSGAADVQGFSKAPPSNLHVRTANLLTFCLSLTYAAHSKSTHTRSRSRTHTHTVHVLCRTDIDKDLCTKLTLSMKIYFRTSSPSCPRVLISQLRLLGFSSAHSHFILFSSSEKYSMFLQTAEIHLYRQTTEGFRNTSWSQMETQRMWLMIQWGI